MPWDGDKNTYLNNMRDGKLPVNSRQFHPNPDVCCEACVFGRGPHARWCAKFPMDVDGPGRDPKEAYS